MKWNEVKYYLEQGVCNHSYVTCPWRQQMEKVDYGPKWYLGTVLYPSRFLKNKIHI